MPKLILHAGLHKTGTTAIQAFSHKNRSALKRQGFLYPDYRPILRKKFEAHHDFAHTIAGQGKRLNLDQTKQLADHWKDIAFKKNLIVLLSSESICRHVDSTVSGSWENKRKAYLENLTQVLLGFEITVLVVLRRQDDYVKSLFQEQVMKNSPAGRQQFSAFRNKFTKSKIQQRFYQNLLLFEEVFPKIQVLLYEDLIRNNKLCTNFFSHLGVSTKGMIDVGLVRPSLSARETVLKIFLNQGIESKKQNKKVLDWLGNKEVKEVLDKHFGKEAFDLWEDSKIKLKFLSNFNEENELIRKRYFPDRECLYPEPDQELKPAVPALTDKCKVDIILNFLTTNKHYHNKTKSYTKRFVQIFFKLIALFRKSQPSG